jgi:hypothetical protein
MQFEEYSGRSEALARDLLKLCRAHVDSLGAEHGQLITFNATILLFGKHCLDIANGDAAHALAVAHGAPFGPAIEALKPPGIDLG